MAQNPLAQNRLFSSVQYQYRSCAVPGHIAAHHEDAAKITLVMGNLNTHRHGTLNETFPPARAKALWDRFEFVHTPMHGSWLNAAEVELNVMIRQCLNRRTA